MKMKQSNKWIKWPINVFSSYLVIIPAAVQPLCESESLKDWQCVGEEERRGTDEVDDEMKKGEGEEEEEEEEGPVKFSSSCHLLMHKLG